MPSDANRRTEYRYNADGRLVELVVFNESTGDQVTQWEYGTTLAESQVASNELVRAKVYADDVSGSDRVEYAYNALGELTEMMDQNGTVHSYDYDGLGRLLHDRVTSLGSGVDGTVRRITRRYDARGLLDRVSSHSSATPGPGSLLDAVEREYNGYGQIVREYQGHDGSAITTDTPHVDYEYESEVENSSRLKKITYPDRREIEYGYGAAESIDDLTDRVATITENEEDLVSYSRRGIQSTVRIGYVEAGVELTYIKQGSEPVGDGGDRYTGLDRFNRIVDVRWLNSSSGADVDRYQYAFDRASNRSFRHNTTAPTSGGNAGWDEAYSYDGVYQLSELERGIPNSGHTAIETMKWQENFTYDETGNWLEYQSQVAGSGPVVQERTHNRGNKIMSIGEEVTTTSYDWAGNMTRMPKVGSWATVQELSWDAWNRLVKVTEDEETVGEYRYDGLTRRIQKEAEENEEWITRDFYYSTQWQVLEERVQSEEVAERQFVWGLRYLDDLVLRDRNPQALSSSSSSSTDEPNALSERVYATHDQWHVTGVLSVGGTVIERYAYKAFGESFILTAAYANRTASVYDWETRFGAYRFDPETKLFSGRYRSLHTAVARWISPDPLFQKSEIQRYAYVDNMVTAQVDVYGLEANPDNVLVRRCGCSEQKVSAEGAKAAAEARKRSQASCAEIPKHIRVQGFSTGREYGGRICCDPRSGVVTHTGPIPGEFKKSNSAWNGEAVDINKSPECGPAPILQVGTYHSHSDDHPGPSPTDVANIESLHGGWPTFVGTTTGVTRTDLFKSKEWFTKQTRYGPTEREGRKGFVREVNPDGTYGRTLPPVPPVNPN